ncbi:MAG: hypothetical protein EA404_08605 [Spirochaetaceae bacterium]|nr:MAG: hypothetical protein EA404_08605 [Spirochaetaceae bacterium]
MRLDELANRHYYMKEMESSDSHSQERTLLEGVLHYLAILVRYRWLIIGMTVAGAVGAVVFSLITLRLPPEQSPLPNRYRAQATLLLGEDPTEGGVGAILESMGMSVPGAGGTASGRLMLQVLNSRSFLDNVIERAGMIEYYGMHGATRTQQRGLVQANSGVSYNDRTGVLAISYEAIHPQYAYQVVNAMVAELDSWFRERGVLTRGRTLVALQETLAEVEREMSEIEDEIRLFQQRYGVLSVEELATSQSTMLRGLETELVQLERAIRTQRERTRIENDPELIRLRTERDIAAQLMREIEAGYAGADRSMPPRAELPQLAQQLGRLQTNLEIQRRIATSLQQQYEVARLSAETSAAFTVLEHAEVPEAKVGPFRGQLSMMITMAAFGAGIALAFLHYGWKSLRANPRLMGIIAQSKSKSKSDESS